MSQPNNLFGMGTAYAGLVENDLRYVERAIAARAARILVGADGKKAALGKLSKTVLVSRLATAHAEDDERQRRKRESNLFELKREVHWAPLRKALDEQDLEENKVDMWNALVKEVQDIRTEVERDLNKSRARWWRR